MPRLLHTHLSSFILPVPLCFQGTCKKKCFPVRAAAVLREGTSTIARGEQGQSAAVSTVKLAPVRAPCPAVLRS